MRDLSEPRYLRALRRRPVDATPIWIMRQAGRYLPEYRRLRAQAGDFMTLCKTPELACEVTLQPLQRFDLDAAIIFSDILTIPDGMRLGLSFVEGAGPRLQHALRSPADIRRLPVIDAREELHYVMRALKLARKELAGRAPLIGFSGGAWTLAAYMVEGGSSQDFARAKSLLREHPAAAHQLLEKNTAVIIDYLRAQVDAGAQALMLFDTWGGLLEDAEYEEFSLRYLRATAAALKAHAPLTIFAKGAGRHLEKLADTGCAALGIDWNQPLADARQRVGARVALQGNMNPQVLYQSDAEVARRAQQIVREFGAHPGHIFNLGHGIPPDVEPARVAALVDAVHAARAASPPNRRNPAPPTAAAPREKNLT